MDKLALEPVAGHDRHEFEWTGAVPSVTPRT
jgi:hypothetical protein